MNRIHVPAPHHELCIEGMAPWPVPDVLSMAQVRADPAARCCKECGRRLLLLLLRSSRWVSHRTEHVSFRDDRSVVRRVTVELHVPELAPIFRGDDGQAYRLVPLSVMRRKTLVNFELHDEEGKSVAVPSLRHNQAITESVLLACADALIEQADSGTPNGAVTSPDIAAFVHQVVSGTQQELAAAYQSVKRKTVAPAVLNLVKNGIFGAILDRLADNFVLWVMVPAGAPLRRVLTFSCDEPLHLRYREPGFNGGKYALGNDLRFWRPAVWCSTLGLTATRIEFPVPAAENTASFHFEIDTPKGIQVTEASLLAGRPKQTGPSLDHVEGGFPTVGLHVIEVPNGSLSRAQVGLRVVTRGWLTTSTLSSWAVFALLLAFATHDAVLKKTGDLPALILVALASGIAALLAQPDAHGLAAHLLKWARALSTIAVALPLVATSFIVFEAIHPAHLPPALWSAVGTSAAIATILSAVWLASWWPRKTVRSPWEQSRADHNIQESPEDFGTAAKKFHYTQPAMRVDSAEGWHTEFVWDQEAENQLIASLDGRRSAHNSGYNANKFPAEAVLGSYRNKSF